MTPRTTKNSVDDARHRDATEHSVADAADVSADVPRSADSGIGGDDRERSADIIWIRAEDLVAISPCAPARPAAQGQRDHDTRRRGRSTGVSGATSPRRSGCSTPRRTAASSRGRGSSARDRTRGPWLDVPATADYLDMTERSVRDLERRGVLPGRRLGRSVRFNLRELDRLLLACREATLEEIQGRSQKAPISPLGPLIAPQPAADHMGLPSVEALLKRVWRLQVPTYRLSDRILRFRAAELDRAISGEDSLTRDSEGPTVDPDACLPRGKEVKQ